MVKRLLVVLNTPEGSPLPPCDLPSAVMDPELVFQRRVKALEGELMRRLCQRVGSGQVVPASLRAFLKLFDSHRSGQLSFDEVTTPGCV